MSKDSNKKKSQQLKMNHSTAAHRLRKAILFRLLQETGKDLCFQCGEKIECIDHLSIEHKIPWLDSEDPIDKFFDLDNIAFSHLDCNIGARRNGHLRNHGGHAMYRGGCRCPECRAYNAQMVAGVRARKKAKTEKDR